MKLEEFKLLDNEKRLEEIFKSVEKTRKYFKWTLIISLVVIVLPLFILPFLVVNLFETLSSFSSLGL